MAFRLTRMIQLGAAYAGLAADLRAQLRNPDGTANGSAVATGFVELGTASPTDPGAYIWDYAAYPDGFRGTVDIYKNSDSQWLVGFSVNPEEVNAAGSGALTAAERDAIADALLARNIAGGSSTGRIVTDALAFLRNKWIVGDDDILRVYGTDDTTLLWSAPITRQPKNQIVSADPA